MTEQFAKDVDQGLSETDKTLSSKYFYNKKGDELFIEIMNMPEYYVTRAEMEIFSEQTDNMMNALGIDPSRHFELVELGAGDGTKTRKLLAALNQQQCQYDYIPIDISKNAIDQLSESLGHDMPETSIKAEHGDYFERLHKLQESNHPKVVLFLGSNIGNMHDTMAQSFLTSLSNNLRSGDKVLLGVDLIKPASVIMPAYNDKKGITEAFNMNLLDRINQELEATFDTKTFEHAPEYDEKDGIAKSYLRSKCDQDVTIKATGKVYQFKKGEKIHTEISRKYNDDILNKILTGTNLTLNNKLTDKKSYFADYILSKE